MIEQQYIKDRGRSLDEITEAVSALRVHGQSPGVVSRARIQTSYHLLLRERAPLAELIVDDCARWEDWSVAPQLMAIYASGQQPWNNTLIMNYLHACPLDSVKTFLSTVSANR